MTDSQIFQILGITFLVMGIGILGNSNFYKKMIKDFTENPPAIYIGGLIALAIGCFMVVLHNSWTKDWSVIITIFGWAVLIKGLFLIVLPKLSIRFSNAFKEMKNFLKVWGIIAAIVGCLLCWLGFFVI